MAAGKAWAVAGAVVAFLAALLHFSAWDLVWPTAQVVRGVRVAQGQLAGLAQTTVAGFHYLSFQGIPFAEPPVGNLRFKAPRKAQPWEGELQATRNGPSCMQVRDKKFKLNGLLGRNVGWNEFLLLITAIPRVLKLMFSSRESEDCLFMNVYTPETQLPTERLLPVLVFVHGGGFVRGSAHSAVYGPDYLVEKDMVVVTFNYRLGIFGFLSTHTSHAPGNAGLLDQVMALEWIRDNIRQFGGDPGRVTLYGESAGAASVHFHVLSPRSRGLFHSAVLSSSSALSTYVLTEDPAERSKFLAKSLGAPEIVAVDPARRVEFLQSKDAVEVSRAFADCMTDYDNRQVMATLPFSPVVENCADGADNHFLCVHPEDTLRDGTFNKVPMIIGLNEYEGTLIHVLDSVEEVVEKINRDVTTFVPKRLYNRLTDAQRVDVGSRIRDQYIRAEAPNDTVTLINMYGDIIVTHSMHVSMRWHAAHATPAAPVYNYYFTDNVFGFYKFLYGAALDGPGHADEMGCVFHISVLNLNLVRGKPKLDATRDKMTEIFANFVHKSTPTSKDSESLNIRWPPATRNSNIYLEFGDTFSIKTDLLKERMQFWDAVYSEVIDHAVYKK